MLPHQVRKKGTSAGQVDVCLGFNTAMADLSSKDGSFFCNYWLVATHIFLGICTPNLGEDEPILDERVFQMAGKKTPTRQIYTTCKGSMAIATPLGLSWPTLLIHRTWEWRSGIYGLDDRVYLSVYPMVIFLFPICSLDLFVCLCV